jgi:hypothetical protein
MGDYVWLTTLEDRDARAAQEAAQAAQIEQVKAVMARVKEKITEDVQSLKAQIKALNKAHQRALSKVLDTLATCERQRDDLQARVECHAQAMRLWDRELRRRIFDAAFACRGGDARTEQIGDLFYRAMSDNEEARHIALAELKALARTPEAVNLDGDGEWPAAMAIHDNGKEFVPAGTKNSKAPKGFAKSR